MMWPTAYGHVTRRSHVTCKIGSTGASAGLRTMSRHVFATLCHERACEEPGET